MSFQGGSRFCIISTIIIIIFIIIIIITIIITILITTKTYYIQESVRPLGQKKNCYVALSRPTVICEKTGSGFFFFFFWKCQIWAKNLLKFVFNGLKKHLYMRFDCIPPEFSPFRNFSKNIGKLNSLTVRKKKKSTDRPNFQILVGWGQHNNYFFGPCL